MKALISTKHFNLSNTYPFSEGKVRDIYNLDEQLLIIATDRISAFDHVLPTPVPGRGIVLTEMTVNWIDLLTKDIANLKTKLPITNHLVHTDVGELPEIFHPFADELTGRFMVVEKCDPIPAELIIRGNITGSLWKAYKKAVKENPEATTVNILGHELPTDLQESEEFPHPLFTPSTKAEAGQHDENISYEQMVIIFTEWLKNKEYDVTAEDLAISCLDLSLMLFTKARDKAKKLGIIIADTKFEFGLKVVEGILYLVIIDEILSSDSSRYWPADEFAIGKSQNSYDKQIVRDYLSKELEWDGTLPIPVIPDEIVKQIIDRYQECMTILFDENLD
ncbi:MAG: phosphoribosylaminoimidazolesuccinocarboxamide synthase [Candidatus Kerfeldbacteria bacterium]